MTATDSERVLGVREIDGEPFGDIMAALESLERSEPLLLLNSFEPESLYGVLEQRGFTYETTQTSERREIRIEHTDG
ncbi:hypothetical protein C482_03351 [Natrialba chahannaoensis JCM 10990]|uniref:DUF2249 domain-containing protein n=2 Tax=Natrialba chahannaoensis TaxID=68911 RepID=M0B3I0_9EURY|nr:hypothetical protein C482_03351 [Natrialba chahannaoensis JCM 10990]